MHIDYQLTEDDVVAYANYLWQHQTNPQRTYRRGLYVGLLVVILGTLFLARDRAGGLNPLMAIVPVLVVCCVVFLLLFVSSSKRFAKAVRNSFRRGDLGKRALEPQRLEITPEGYTQRGELGATITLWKAVEKVAVTKDHLFIFLTKTTALIVPAHAFPDEWEFAEFAETAQRYHEAAVHADEAP